MRGAELLVTDGEQKNGKTMPDLRFRINKERLQMYINLKNPARAKEQLAKLEETAKAAKKSRVIIFLIYDSFYLLTKLRHSSVGCTRKALKN